MFREVPSDALQALAYLCKRMRYKQGEFIFTQNDEDDQAYYLLEGSAELIYQHNGVETLMRRHDKGEFIGGMTLLADVRRIFSLRVVEPVHCIVLSRRKVTADPEKAAVFLKTFGRALTSSIVDWEQRQINEALDAGLDIATNLRVGVSLV